MAEEQDEKAKEIIKRQERLRSDRMNFDSHWEEIAERVLPRMKGMFNSNFGSQTKGEKNTEKMYDATAAVALDRFAAVMDSMLTPQNSKWHRLRSTDDRLNRDAQVARYFDEVAATLFRYRYAPRAGFATQNHERYVSLGAFGTGCLFVDRLEGGGLRYRCHPLAELYLQENHQGIVDVAHRRFTMTARQARLMFRDKLPEKIAKAAEDTPEREFEFVHAIYPNNAWEPYRLDSRGKKWSSCYVAVDGCKVVEEGGYSTFPYASGRYVMSPGETYGRSPAMMVLPNIKVLNEQKKTLLRIGHRLVDPVLLAHDDGIIDAFSVKPGAINYGGIDAQGRKLVQPLDTPSANPLGSMEKLMEQERAPINDAFLVTLFQILVESPTMTATEVLERAREKGILLGPAMSRQQSEYLGPLIERELDILSADGLLPPMPPVLQEAEGEYDVVYDSPLSRNMRYEEATGLMRLVEMAGTYANATQDPRPLDWFNFDSAIPALADIQAVPASWISTPEEVAATRQKRDQAAAMKQLTDAAPGAAAMVKALNPAERRAV